MPDTSLHRSVVASIEHSLDFDPDDTSSGTWITVPRTQVLADGYEAFGEQAETVQGMNSTDLMAMILARGVLPLALKADDTFQTNLKSATTNLTPIWFRIRELGKNTRKIIGGQFGCHVVYTEQAVPNPASLQMAMVQVSAPANESGQAIQEYAPTSGSGVIV